MPNAITGLLADPRGEMRASPRNRLLGLLADALSGANEYAQRPDPTMPGGKANPVLGLLADAASLNSLATTAQRASYGEPLTNGMRGSKAFLKPETADVAMMAPISPRNALAALGMGMADTGAAKAIFAGIGAKTADKAALAQAEKMAAKGADPKAIWRDTGWFKGGDGKWRFEIDDSSARMAGIDPMDNVIAEFKRGGAPAMQAERERLADYTRPYLREGRTMDIDQVFEHEPLTASYPDLMHYGKYQLDPSPIIGEGSYSPKFDKVTLSRANEPTARSAMLHELQHAIQEREGFARGGNLEQMPSVLENLAAKKRSQARRLFDESQRNDPLAPGEILKPGARKRGLEAEKQARELEGLLGRINEFGDGMSYEAYKRLAGEAEARAVQQRMNLPPEARRLIFPLDSYDVPINSLIYR